MLNCGSNGTLAGFGLRTRKENGRAWMSISAEPSPLRSSNDASKVKFVPFDD